MAQITVRGDGPYTVEVRDAGGATTHTVTIPEGYPAKVGADAVPPERLLEESFRFMLEREPKESILREFALPVIARYFPEYPREIASRLA